MAEIKTKKDLMEYLIERAKDYAPKCRESVIRNKHMNEIDAYLMSSDLVEDECIDAILVDFVNYIGMHQGIDLGLYATDLNGVIEEE